MNFGIMFFSSYGGERENNKYELLIEAAKFCDKHNFTCVWTPERHFHEFGGLFPNPAIASAALAMITRSIQIRAGSLISPLHNTLRIAEEWAAIDNLSNGRVAIAFGSGWNANDFVFFPERYATRHGIMYEQIKTINDLWQGGRITQTNSFGKEIEVSIYPKPVQKQLPIWITSSGNVDTYISAGAIGANILTHLIGQDIESLAEKIRCYRESRESNGFDPDQGIVSLMLHTFVGPHLETVRATVREPFREYLRSAISLEEKAAHGGGLISGGHQIDPHDIPAEMMEDLLDITFERYFQTAALMGTPETCRQFLWKLEDIGVDEIACLIDFHDNRKAILNSLHYLNELKESFSKERMASIANPFAENIEYAFAG